MSTGIDTPLEHDAHIDIDMHVLRAEAEADMALNHSIDTQIDTLERSLDDMLMRTLERTQSKRDVIRRLTPRIDRLRQAGRTMTDIADVLRRDGLDISVHTLRAYMRNTKKANKNKKKGGKTCK